MENMHHHLDVENQYIDLQQIISFAGADGNHRNVIEENVSERIQEHAEMNEGNAIDR